MAVPTRLLSPLEPLFEREADFIVARGTGGEFGVLPGHAPLLTWLKPGELMVRHDQKEEFFFLEGGYVEVLPNRVTILANRGVPVSQLDPSTAEDARRAAEDAIAKAVNPGPDDLAELERQLEIANFRLQAAERDRRRRRD
ncbi:MAG: ATP synthase F1 subunit epsilon [Candidatus Dormiibacterota bacterium]